MKCGAGEQPPGGESCFSKGYTIVIDSMRAYASAAGISVKITTSKDVEGTVVIMANWNSTQKHSK